MNRFLVYLWATKCRQFVKIGRCQKNLHQRARQIQTGCPLGIPEYPAGVIICEDKADMLKVEKASQERFKAYRTHGEWFELTSEISEYIQDFTDTESGKAFVDEDRESAREYQQQQRQNNPKIIAQREERERKRQHQRQKEKINKRRQKRSRERHRERKKKEARKKNAKYQRERYARKKRECQQLMFDF